MFQIEIQIGKKLFANLEAGFAEMDRALKEAIPGASVPVSRVLRDTLQRVARTMGARHSSPWNGSVVNTTDKLQRRSGGSLEAMKQSIHVTGSGNFENIEGEISTGFWAIHETGGTIRPTRSKYLTIPLPAAMDANGVPIKANTRAWDNTFVARSKRGNLLIFQKRGGRGIVPLYLLKESVYIKPRLKMQDTLLDDALPYFERRAFDAVERAILRSFDA